jgi:hypothetical protein
MRRHAGFLAWFVLAAVIYAILSLAAPALAHQHRVGIAVGAAAGLTLIVWDRRRRTAA